MRVITGTRTDGLAQPKPNPLRFPDRRSVYWLDELPTRSKNNSTAAFELTPRLERLTQSKQSSRFYKESRRSPEWTLSVVVKTAMPSPRVCDLAQPKRAKMVLTQAPSVDSSTHAFGIPTTPSSRILQLASPKQVHALHALARPVSWPVPDRVLKAVASESLQSLARPKTRQALFEGYDPYRVSPAARAATASPRLLELSLPLPRKCKGQ